jgi:hypothetical protein
MFLDAQRDKRNFCKDPLSPFHTKSDVGFPLQIVVLPFPLQRVLSSNLLLRTSLSRMMAFVKRKSSICTHLFPMTDIKDTDVLPFWRQTGRLETYWTCLRGAASAKAGRYLSQI